MSKDNRSFRILVIEDNLGDFVLVEEYLSETIQDPHISHALSFRQAVPLLQAVPPAFDIILLDITLQDKRGTELILDVLNLAGQIPVVILTGYSDLEFSTRALSLGISDYLMKDELTAPSLYKSLVYSIERKWVTSQLKDSEQRYKDLFHLSPLPMMVYDLETLKFLDVNVSAMDFYGYSLEEFLSMNVRDIRPEKEIPLLEQNRRQLDDSRASPYHYGIYTHRKKNGDLLQADIHGSRIAFQGRPAELVLVIDLTERIEYIKAIETQNRKFREIAWIQSHVVRAPLARILGLLQMLGDSSLAEQERLTFLDWVHKSAEELDVIIRDISQRTDQIAIKKQDEAKGYGKFS